MAGTKNQYFANVTFHLLMILYRLPWWLNDKEFNCMQETRVQSLSQGYSLEKEIATHPSILAWEIQRIEEPGGLQFMR